MDLDHLKTWVGRTETVPDRVTPFSVQALSATLDRDDPIPKDGDVLPLLWHWLYFLPIARASMTGPDGHPKRGGFLPPVELPRRMWAGGRYLFARDLHVGEKISRCSTILDVTAKTGRTGTLVFVKVGHEIIGEGGVAVFEEHDIVYRDLPVPTQKLGGDAPPPPRTAPTDAVWSKTIVPDDVLLFRYSALTFNGHRIHYDRRYVTTEEGYPGLIVHGPLIATLLMELYRQHDNRRLAKFSFRALSPTFDIAPFVVSGRPTEGGATLWAAGDDGSLRMEATAEWRA
jgi:3-methylfumaryl-CoA hydratase